MALKDNSGEAEQDKSMLTIWQIDSFEGGKGSRADFLQRIGNDFTKSTDCYVSVISLSANAVRLNLAEGRIPDIISYGAGVYGLESYIGDYVSWCHGGYCFLTLDAASDFSDVNSQNTVINEGKENLSKAAALFCGLHEADFEKSAGAYVKLITGSYKYLLGTQRDIFRLKTRGLSFAVKPVTEFNDLYQNISVVTLSPRKSFARQYVETLLKRTGEVDKIGMLSDSVVYDDEMKAMSGLSYEYKLTAPVGESAAKQLENIISGGDINMLKTILK